MGGFRLHPWPPGVCACTRLPEGSGRGVGGILRVTVTPGHSCLKLRAPLGRPSCPRGPRPAWCAETGTAGAGGMEGRCVACQWAAVWAAGPARRNHPSPGQSVSSRQQGCQPRAGERRPWEPGAADLSPPLSTACFSSHTLCVWPGHRLVSLSPVRPSLATVALSLWWPGPPSLSWAHAHGLTWGNAGSTSLRVDFIEAEAGCANPGSAWIWDVRPR